MSPFLHLPRLMVRACTQCSGSSQCIWGRGSKAKCYVQVSRAAAQPWIPPPAKAITGTAGSTDLGLAAQCMVRFLDTAGCGCQAGAATAEHCASACLARQPASLCQHPRPPAAGGTHGKRCHLVKLVALVRGHGLRGWPRVHLHSNQRHLGACTQASGAHAALWTAQPARPPPRRPSCAPFCWAAPPPPCRATHPGSSARPLACWGSPA